MTQLLHDRTESQVVGAEVVTPLGDALCLVDHEQRRPGGADALEHRRVAQLLGRHEQELELALLELGQQVAALAYADRRGELCGLAGSLVAGQRPTWSRCNARSGETTTVGPSINSPATW